MLTDVTEDPYLMEESNLTACNALDSSLWEIKTLQSHVLPEIAFAAKFIDRELPRIEWDISQDLELSIEDVITFQYSFPISAWLKFNLILQCVLLV